MFCIGVLILLIVLSVFHWLKNRVSISKSTPVPNGFLALEWTAMALVLGLSLGSLSLNTFEALDGSVDLEALRPFFFKQFSLLLPLTLILFLDARRKLRC